MFGFWSEEESCFHINLLETKSILFAFKALFRALSDIYILIKCDNTTSVAYINNVGGVRSPDICDIVIELYDFCNSRNIRIQASHLAGRFNSHADALSRKSRDHCYSLPHALFSHILDNISFVPIIDLFASRLNNLLQDYYSEGPDPFALNFDSFICPWPDKVYAFPPIHLVHKFIARFLNLKITYGLLICPFLPSQPYFSLLLDMLIDDPFLISASEMHHSHLLPKKLCTFLACSITSNHAKKMEYQERLQPVCYGVSHLAPYASTSDVGSSLQIGVINGKSVMGVYL